MHFVHRTITVFHSLGFTIHSEKSQFVPYQKVNFLSFILDSIAMALSLKLDKAANLILKLTKQVDNSMMTLNGL